MRRIVMQKMLVIKNIIPVLCDFSVFLCNIFISKKQERAAKIPLSIWGNSSVMLVWLRVSGTIFAKRVKKVGKNPMVSGMSQRRARPGYFLGEQIKKVINIIKNPTKIKNHSSEKNNQKKSKKLLKFKRNKIIPKILCQMRYFCMARGVFFCNRTIGRSNIIGIGARRLEIQGKRYSGRRIPKTPQTRVRKIAERMRSHFLES